MLNRTRLLLFDLVEQTEVHLRAAFNHPCVIKMRIFPNASNQRSNARRSGNRHPQKNRQVSQQGRERKSLIPRDNLQINLNQEAAIPISGISITLPLSLRDCILNDADSILNVSLQGFAHPNNCVTARQRIKVAVVNTATAVVLQ